MLKRIALIDSMKKAKSDYFDVLSMLIRDYENEVSKPENVGDGKYPMGSKTRLSIKSAKRQRT
jgi:hypothetical protein